MPLYSDSSYYYGSGTGGAYSQSSLYSPYYTSGLYGSSTSSTSSPYAPYSSIYNRSTYTVPSTPSRTSNYSAISSRYKPKLTTISESPLSPRHVIGVGGVGGGGLMPLTRTQSPKFSTFALTSKYIPPRPIAINTADIDVSSSRYQKHEHVRKVDEIRERGRDRERERRTDIGPAPIQPDHNNNDESHQMQATTTTTSPYMPRCDGGDDQQQQPQRNNRSTIKRNRPIVRLSTVRSRSKERASSGKKPQVPEVRIVKSSDLVDGAAEKVSWRQKFEGDELSLKSFATARKSPGDLLRERYYIKHKDDEEAECSPSPVRRESKERPQKVEDPPEEVVFQVDPLRQTSIRRLSIPKCPSFHEICEDISSDKIDDDLNAGELRRRASIIHEQEIEILNQLQKSDSGTYQFITLERNEDESRKSIKRKSKKIRHRITATVDIENAPLTQVAEEEDSAATQPKFTYNVDTVDEHHQIHKVFKLPKKKVKTVKKDEEKTSPKKVKTSIKKKSPPKKVTEDTNPTKVDVIPKKFAPKIAPLKLETIDQQKPLESIITPAVELKMAPNVKSTSPIAETPKTPTTKKSSPPKTPTLLKTIESNAKPSTDTPKSPTTKVLKKLSPLKTTTTEPQLAKPKGIVKLQKSDSGEDFWSQMGSRETLYMNKRKQNILEDQWEKRETLLEDQTSDDVKNLSAIKTKVTSQKIEALKQAEGSQANKGGRSQSNESVLRDAKRKESKEPQAPKTTNPTVNEITSNNSFPKINSGPAAKSPETKSNNATSVAILSQQKEPSSSVASSTSSTTAEESSITKIESDTHAKPAIAAAALLKDNTTTTTPIRKGGAGGDVAAISSSANDRQSGSRQTITVRTSKTDRNEAIGSTQPQAEKQCGVANATTATTVPPPVATNDDAAEASGSGIDKPNRSKSNFVDNDVLNLRAAASSAAVAVVSATTAGAQIPASTAPAPIPAAASVAAANANNLSKFPTVSNLAQCLLDVDADLEDYIPSSAEETDSTSYDSSSESGGGENLTASMKKKNKHRKKLAKAEAQKFDPNKVIKIDPKKKCYVKEEAPRYPLVATPRPLWKREKFTFSEESESDSDETESESECTTSDEYEDELNPSKDTVVRMSTCSNDSGFEGGTAPPSPKKMLDCDVNCHKKCEKLTANLCGVNQKLIVEALLSVRRETSYTYSQFQKSGRITAPATTIPRFKKYSVEDFHFLAVLGKGSFGKVLLAELRNTDFYYAVKCLKKDVVLEDDDVECTLIERKVLALGTKHPYLCHLFCTFQTESHLFFVMEYLNGGDLMFHIQESGRFPENRARFYGAEIISGLKFLHRKGIIYRDLKLDNVLLDFDGHVRIADFGMCKLQIYLDKTADSFCGTPDYMAPEIIKGEKYNQNVDWWSFGVLLYEMLIGQSPFSGCDEDELFWSICNEIPWFPVYITQEATSMLKGLLQKDSAKRIGSQYSPAGDVCDHSFFREIDWQLLEKRQLEPPFKPQVKHPLDTQYFDKAFTRERVRLTPIDKEILQSMDQEQFQGFSYTNPNATLD